jgi:hypothetical protein
MVQNLLEADTRDPTLCRLGGPAHPRSMKREFDHGVDLPDYD